MQHLVIVPLYQAWKQKGGGWKIALNDAAVYIYRSLYRWVEELICNQVKAIHGSKFVRKFFFGRKKKKEGRLASKRRGEVWKEVDGVLNLLACVACKRFRRFEAAPAPNFRAAK